MNSSGSPPRIRAQQEGGFSLIEALVGICLTCVSMLVLINASNSAQSLVSVNHDTILATQAARQVAEQLHDYDAVTFRKLFATFNTVTADDPSGAGTAPGAFFQVDGLRPQPTDGDGFTGEIRFPTGVGGATLREDVAGRDLNADGKIDTLDHAADYVLLPVTVRIDWLCGTRNRSIEIQTLLVDR